MARKGILTQEEINALLGIAKSGSKLVLKETKVVLTKGDSKSIPEDTFSAVNLMISAMLTHKTITLENYLNLQVGDFLPLELTPTITINIAKAPIFTATIERNIDKRALKLVDRFNYD
jgi:flagellar motor switch protein FliM